MALILLIRHALTEATGKRLSGRGPGLHLSDRGREQASALADRLRAMPLTAVYTSPLERCVETAEVLCRDRVIEARALPDVLEVEYGRWTGRPLAQLARTSLWKRVQQAPSTVRFPEGESLAEVQSRAAAALNELAERHPKGSVAVVTHAEVIRLAMAHFAGVHLDLFQRLIIHPASVSAIAVGPGIPRIIRLNDTGTLQDLVPRRPRSSRRSVGVRGPLR
jgi:probable phosphomutase (TIGR03848 family)